MRALSILFVGIILLGMIGWTAQPSGPTGLRDHLLGDLAEKLVRPLVESEPKEAIDPRFPRFVPSVPPASLGGIVTSVGSDTMNNLMTLWSEDFRQHFPSVGTEVEGKGSSAGPPALMRGRALFAPMSRDLKTKEVDAFVREFGYRPTVLPTSIDMVVCIVNKDNPLDHLTLAQVDAIFSKSRRRGFRASARTWGDLGVTDPAWRDLPISGYGRNAASGTYQFFKQMVLFDGDFLDSIKEQPGSSAVVQAVARDRSAIGYCGLGYRTADVKVLRIDTGDGAPIEPTIRNALAGDYPLARHLWLVLNVGPNTTLDPLRSEFIRYVFSADGQRRVLEDGYFPVEWEVARSSLSAIGISLDVAPRRVPISEPCRP